MKTFGITAKSHRLIVEALQQFPELENVYIFGSRAKGNYERGSDIDLALSGEAVQGDLVFQVKRLLNERLPIPYHVDVVGLQLLDHQELKKHIQRWSQLFWTNPKAKRSGT